MILIIMVAIQWGTKYPGSESPSRSVFAMRISSVTSTLPSRTAIDFPLDIDFDSNRGYLALNV